ncbi:hypothetical protein ESA94_04290 [Lacibacter luteus]|uniref:Proton-coupled thiamine transporter YuaJ n=1 Tax=Lacibacter luteus TaxID=2508719 RepID=A0A4Q1CMF0_9BACT|nr:DUF6580 family putative transport protein [Lacibacter luteus]RXK62237.1 hypothetical protein ESA94_04290 [Lacibacter luteus]
MKSTKTYIITLVALVIVAALYRIIPGRPFGFAPQIAIALFAGSVIKDKKYAFALPILSMFISDALYQVLYSAGLSSIKGFYGGQLTNYILFVGLTVIGFFINQKKVLQIFAGALAGPTAYFLISNFLVWIGGGGYGHPKTFAGLMATYVDGIPFYGGSLAATVLFCTMFFGGYALFNTSKELKTAQ